MRAHMRKHHISDVSRNSVDVIYRGIRYIIPLTVARKYKVSPIDESNISIDDAFSDLIDQYTESGALLKGIRAREGMTQIEFAKKIKITQANLSAMENGKRTIGKEIAKRIEKAFKIDYRLFL